ncbi:hypothetical protein ACVIJW_011337 [Bradyrhizobium barranii subsp. barranii]|jgi:hypothetical protein
MILRISFHITWISALLLQACFAAGTHYGT